MGSGYFGAMTKAALRRLSIVTLLLVTPFASALAQEELPGPHIAIDLIAETDRPAPGQEVTLAFASTPQPGWHGYWKNPGEAGIETQLAWTLPTGVAVGPLAYPVPQKLLIAGIMNYVYEGPFTQFATVRIPADAAVGTRLPLRVRTDYLVCTDEICVPESAELSTVLTVGDGAIDPARRAQFDRWRRALPRPIGSPATFAVTGSGADARVRIAIPYPADAPLGDPAAAYFFPLTAGAIDYGAAQTVTRDGDRLLIDTVAAGSPTAIEGVLKLGEGDGFQVRAAPGAVPTTAGGGGAVDWQLAALALLGAIAGGLILNIMPCVFPILSLKALSLAKAGESDAHARAEGLAYTAGVVLVCAALGAMLLGLRAAGATVGWAFQLQDPRVILVLLLLVSAIALNLAGLFELPTPQFAARATGGGTKGAFATGALAAFIATPCTGPFMGAALGAALILPWWAAMLIFIGLGLGLALPFLLLGFVPALRRRLPRPGPWMDNFRKALSVPMFLTALALAWILGRQAGVNGMALGLGAVLVAAIGLWWTGRRQAGGKGRQWLPAVPALALALAATALVQRAPAQATDAVAALPDAQAFSETKLATLRAENRPVFAYFTADWCVTCKVNEKAAIETAAVARAFGDGKVAVLVGDWTNGDPALGRFIERHNRAGVPLYLWYAPGSDEPKVLPQVLTQAMLTDLADGGKAGG